MKFLRVLQGAIGVAVPTITGIVDPRVLVNLGVGAFVKHIIPGRSINQAIPYINLGVGAAIVYAKAVHGGADPVGSIFAALQASGAMAAAATGVHQLTKLPLAAAITGPLAEKVGPGAKFSI